MTGSLQGLHLLVTGGGSGIARAAAERYHREGGRVTVLERSAENAADLRAAFDGAIQVFEGDATDPAALAEAVAAASDDEGRLHHATSGVGIFDYYAKVTQLEATELLAAAEECWRVNVLSALLLANAAAKALQAGNGSLTLTVSESAYSAIGGGVLYGTSKWAIRGMVDHLAAEMAPLRVNGVAPGGTTSTRFSGLATLAQQQTADMVSGRDERIASGSLLGITPFPEDHAGAYRYLADPVDSRAVTGIVIRSNAGRRA